MSKLRKRKNLFLALPPEKVREIHERQRSSAACRHGKGYQRRTERTSAIREQLA
jgi:hypothetical protein